MIRRLRKPILLTGTLLCVLIAAAFVASAWWQFTFQIPRANGPAMVLMAGSAMLVGDGLPIVVSTNSHSYGLSRWNSWKAQRVGVWESPRRRMWAYLAREIPLYVVFLAVAVPTLLAWRFWPKPVKPGHCRCGYDLTGNTSGVCPECGVEVQA